MVARLLVVLSFTAVGCEHDTVMSVESYDRSCAYDSDCVIVYEGDVCTCSCDAASRDDISSSWPSSPTPST